MSLSVEPFERGERFFWGLTGTDNVYHGTSTENTTVNNPRGQNLDMLRPNPKVRHDAYSNETNL